MISELPTGLDVVTIYIPDIDVNKLTIVIEFLYKGQIRLLSEDYKDFEEVMTILGIEFQVGLGHNYYNPNQYVCEFSYSHDNKTNCYFGSYKLMR